MRRRGRLGLTGEVLLAAILAAVASADRSDASPPGQEPYPAVTVREEGRTVTVEAELPGSVLGLAPACGGDGPCRGLWLMVRAARSEAESATDAEAAPAEGTASDGTATAETPAPPRLLRFDPVRAAAGDPAAALAEPTAWLPAETEILALVDLDGDGAAELVAGEPGRIWSLGDPAAPQPPLPVLTGPAVDLAAVRGLIVPALPRFPTTAVGRLRWYGPGAGSGLALAGSAALPVQTQRRAHGLELTSPPPSLLPASGGEPPRWAVGPEAHGDRRLRSLLIDPLAGDEDRSDEDRRDGYWSMLPGPESVHWSRYLRLDGEPVLAVLTHASDRLGIFDQKRLRLFRLAADRTRAGADPVLAIETTSHRWQPARVVIADLDGDGHDDVSVAQVKGLDGKAILVASYRGLGGGRFARKPGKVRLGDAAFYWRWIGDPPDPADLDGDRLPDLITLVHGKVLVYTSGGRRAGQALAERPRWEIAPRPEPESEDEAEEPEENASPEEEEAIEIEIEGGEMSVDLYLPRRDGVPAALDLDGDGRAELIFRDPLPDGRERLRVVFLR